jgi:uncharacterized protein involved in exopolysaccharide biosynthesis
MGMYVSSSNRSDDDEMDLRSIFVTLWSARKWILASVAFFSVVSVAVAFLMTPIYRAKSVLMPAAADDASLKGTLGSALGSLGGLASLAGVNVNAKGAEVEEALAVLQSRHFIETFIRDRRLAPVMFPDKWDAKAKAWKKDEEPTPARAYKMFVKDILSVVQDNRSSLVTIQIDWRERQLAADWANELVARLNAEMRARALRKTEASLGFLGKEMTRTSILGTQDAISRLMEAQINQRMLANVTEEYAFRVVDPATAPDQKDRLRPNRPIIVAIGVIAGALLGVLGILLATLFAPRPQEVHSRAPDRVAGAST